MTDTRPTNTPRRPRYSQARAELAIMIKDLEDTTPGRKPPAFPNSRATSARVSNLISDKRLPYRVRSIHERGELWLVHKSPEEMAGN